jgi:hypothetical protein
VKKLGDEPVTIEEMRLRLNISATHHRNNSSVSKQNRLGSPMMMTERGSDNKLRGCENGGGTGKCSNSNKANNFGGC